MAVALLGCSAPSAAPGDLPAPGTMRVVSVEPLAGAPEDASNLLVNGYFKDWWAGAPAPSGFGPPAAEFSSLERVVQQDGSIACVQRWKKSDLGVGHTSRFYAELKGAKAEQAYELVITAQSVDGCSAVVHAFEIEAEGSAPVSVSGDIVIPPAAKTATEFKHTFSTKKGGQLLLVARAKDKETPPGKIIWGPWRLQEVAAQ